VPDSTIDGGGKLPLLVHRGVARDVVTVSTCAR